MIYVPGDKIITSFDDLIKWSDMKINTSLPDPKDYENRVFDEFILDNNPVTFRQLEDGTIPAASHYQIRHWKRDRVMFDNRTLFFWELLR
jgi:hypothetical protein